MDKSEQAKALDANASKQKLKVLQVVHNFFSKALQIILLSRTLLEQKSDGSPVTKINKWFNLYIPSIDDDAVRHELRPWKLHLDLSLFPPMIIETCVDLGQLSPHEHIVLEDDSKSVWPVSEGEQKEIVVERWLVKFDCNLSFTLRPSAAADELPLMYKQAIILLRTIYTLVRLLPSFKLRKLMSKPSGRNLALVNHFLDGSQPVTSRNRIGLSKSIIPQHLLGESHLTQRDFTPIETSLGTLSVSVVYRNHYKFRAQDQEERLSNQFAISDKEEVTSAFLHFESAESPVKVLSGTSTIGSRVTSQRIDGKTPFRGSFEQFRERFLVLPCTSDHLERLQLSPSRGGTTPKGTAHTRPAIQPFRVGSIGGTSPPHQGSHSPVLSNVHGSVVERRVSITSNRSGSNASLIALLRNPRVSSSSTPGAVGGASNTALLPRSIASSHASHLPQEDTGGEIAGTPKFLSSFGLRQSRRFSSTSGRAGAPVGVEVTLAHTGSNYYNGANYSNYNVNTNNLYMGASFDLNLSCAPSSGLYIDDDISSFVRMIDGKLELRLSTSNSDARTTPPGDSHTPADALNRFHLLKSQYQQLGDSVNASLVLQKHYSSRDSQSIDSRLTGNKLAFSVSSQLPPVVGPSSFDNEPMPSITSRLSSAHISGVEGSETTGAGHNEGGSSQPEPSSRSLEKKDNKAYHDVFEDEEDSADFYARARHDKCNAHEMDYDNDDLLFEMTDTK